MDQRVRDALAHLAKAGAVGVISLVVALVGQANYDPAPFADNETAEIVRGVGFIGLLVAAIMAVTALWMLARALSQPSDSEDAETP